MNNRTTKHAEVELDRLGERALIQRTHLLFQNNESNVIAEHYREHQRDEIGALHRFARVFANNPLPLLAKIIPAKNEFRIQGLAPAYLELLNHLSKKFKRIRNSYQQYKQSPIFDTFEAVQRRFQGINCSTYRTPMTEQQATYLIKKLETAARCLHRRLRSTFVRKAYSNFRRNSHKTFRHLLAYLDSCFRTRSNLLAIRLDLGFRLHDQQIISPEDPEQTPNFEEVAMWRDQFSIHLEKTFKTGLIGRIFKIEHGPEKKFHVHCLILLDAAKHQQDVMIGKQLGEYWSESITRGRGGYFNVNGSSIKHRWSALGKIDGTNPTVQIGMQLIAAYFTLAESFIKPTFAGNRRTFTPGCITEPRRPQKSKRNKYIGGISNVNTREAIDRIKFI